MRTAMAFGMLALTATLAACQTPPRQATRGGPPPACSPEKQFRDPAEAMGGGDLAANVVALAFMEWDRFGRQTWRYRAGASEGVETRRGVRETARPDWVQRYWRAIGEPRSVEDIPRVAWSAAFVSWAMIQAGVPTAAFCGAPAHSMYLESIWTRQRRDPAAPFALHPPATIRPSVGDLVCATRRGENGVLSEIAVGRFRDAEGRFLPSHCDIVIGVDRGARRLEAIGGNVADSTTMSVLDLDAEGFLIVARDRERDPRPWIAIVENRYRRTAPPRVAAR